jgi:general L-amino acid transport system substrate-binding protein
MKKPLAFAIVFVSICVFITAARAQQTLKAIQSRGKLQCGVHEDLPGFSTKGQDGRWQGFDVDFCRALAAAIFDDPNRVTFKPYIAKERFGALSSGVIDVLSRNTTWTLQRDVTYGFDFGPILFYDGQGMMASTAMGSKMKGPGATLAPQPERLQNLNGAKICVQVGTTTDSNLEDFFRRYQLTYTPVRFKLAKDMYRAYDKGNCEIVTSDISQLLAQKSTLKDPASHAILGLLLSKEPLAPVIRRHDYQWHEIVKWVGFGLIQAEEFGITSQNLSDEATSPDPAIRRFLGLEDDFVSNVGLSNDFMVRVIRHVGNYREIYDRNLKPLDVQRGANALWNQGGLLFSPPFR